MGYLIRCWYWARPLKAIGVNLLLLSSSLSSSFYGISDSILVLSKAHEICWCKLLVVVLWDIWFECGVEKTQESNWCKLVVFVGYLIWFWCWAKLIASVGVNFLLTSYLPVLWCIWLDSGVEQARPITAIFPLIVLITYLILPACCLTECLVQFFFWASPPSTVICLSISQSVFHYMSVHS